MPHSQAPDKKLSVQLSVLTGLQILASFGMQWYVITYYGAGPKTDALYTGVTVPSLLSILLIESLMVVLVPMLATSSEKELNERGWFLFASMGVSFSIISVLLFFLVPLLMPLLVPGFSAAGKEQTVAVTQIQVFILIGGACNAVLAAMYQVRGRFIAPPAAVFVSGALSFVLLVSLLPRFGIVWAAWVQVFNAALPAVLLLPALKPIVRPKLQRELMKTTWVKIRPLLVSKGYYIASAPLDRILASFLAPGSIAIFELAGRFYNAVIRILSQGVVTPFIPRLSRLAHEENWREFRSQYRKQLVMVSVPAVAVTLAVAVGGILGLLLLPRNSTQPVIGSLNAESVARLIQVMLYMAGLVPCVALINALTNGYYAKGDTRTPTRVGMIAFTIGVGMKFVGFYAGGLMGLAVTVSIYAVVYCIVLYVLLERQVKCLLAAKGLAPDLGAETVMPGLDASIS